MYVMEFECEVHCSSWVFVYVMDIFAACIRSYEDLGILTSSAKECKKSIIN
jgi:hypothetical protein